MGNSTNYKTRYLIVFLALFVLLGAYRYWTKDKSHSQLAYQYGHDIIKTLEPRAVLFVNEANVVSILHQLQVDKKIPSDVLIFDYNSNPICEGLSRRERTIKQWQFLKKTLLAGQRPVYCYDRSQLGALPGYVIKPVGLLYRFLPADKKVVMPVGGANYWDFYGGKKAIPKDQASKNILANYYFHAAENLEGSNESAAAYQNYQVASQMAKGFDLVHNQIGWAYAQRKWYNLAEKEYQKASSLPEAHNNLGGIFYTNGRLAEAQKECLAAIALDPDFASAHNSLGAIYISQGYWEKGEAELKQALRLNPTIVSAYLNLGILAWNKGDYQPARAYFKEGLKIDKDNQQLIAALKQLEKGLINAKKH